MTDTLRTNAIAHRGYNESAYIAEMTGLARELERELEQERQDRKQADLDTIRALGERNDARSELEQIEAILANPLAVHLNMMRGTIQWTPANLRHLLGESMSDTPAEIDAHLDECVAKSAASWKPLPGDLP